MMAVDGADRPVAGAGSQLGWLLWSGALDEHAAEAAADRLVRPDVLTDFGVRTLSVDHPRFGPALYHRGAVWPFDNWIAWGALRAMRRSADADRIRTGVLKAVRKLGRYPELYAVHTSGQLLAVPVANQVQAWTVGAMVAFGSGWDGHRSSGQETPVGRPGVDARPNPVDAAP